MKQEKAFLAITVKATDKLPPLDLSYLDKIVSDTILLVVGQHQAVRMAFINGHIKRWL